MAKLQTFGEYIFSRENKVQTFFFQGPLAEWVYVGGFTTTQLYRDYFISHEIRIPINQPGFNGMSLVGLVHVAQMDQGFGDLGGKKHRIISPFGELKMIPFFF